MICEAKMLSFLREEMPDPAPYHLLTSIVAPRPIAWVSTVGRNGVHNLAPFSFFTAVAGCPPTLLFSVSYSRKLEREKDTLRNVREVGEFVSHVVDEATAQAMVRTAMSWPPNVCEIEEAGLTAVPSIDVRPLRIAEAPVAMECAVTDIIPVRGATDIMVLGEVLRFHVREDLYRPELGLVNTMDMKPITRLGGPIEYTKLGELIYLPIPEF